MHRLEVKKDFIHIIKDITFYVNIDFSYGSEDVLMFKNNVIMLFLILIFCHNKGQMYYTALKYLKSKINTI